MLEKLKNKFKLKRKPQSVYTGIYRHADNDQFIVGYGFRTKRPRNIGKGDTLQEALENTAEIINRPEKQPARERRHLLKNTEETSLTLDLYYNEVEENYTLAITDNEETEITGTGRNVSSAFKDLAENIQIEPA